MSPRIIVLMGVSGSGKTAVGERAAERLGWRFVDADSLHPPANITKMANGTPLTDADRWPWLDRVRAVIERHMAEGEGLIVACSALKRSYRERLHQGDAGVHIIYLKGSYALIHERMTGRTDHFFEPEMLRSQFEALEEPTADEPVSMVAIDKPLDAVVSEVVSLAEA